MLPNHKLSVLNMMNGKQNEFWSLVEPEQNKARAFCRKLIGNRDDGDDLYQDSLVAALVNIEQLESEASFKPWLYRIIVNRFKNKVRTSWWKKSSTITNEIESTIVGDNPIGLYTARRRLEKAFKVLKTDDRILVTLFELEGWSIAEIASLCNKKEGAVKVKLSRAREKMRVVLAKDFRSTKTNKTFNVFETEDEICVAGKPSKN